MMPSRASHDDITPPEYGGGPLHFPEQDHLKETDTTNLVARNAKLATEKEHHMTLWQGIKLYPKAVAWSLLISTCICMEGYDLSLLSNFYGFPQFNKKYGEQLPNGTYQVPARWQAGLSNGVCCPVPLAFVFGSARPYSTPFRSGSQRQKSLLPRYTSPALLIDRTASYAEAH